MKQYEDAAQAYVEIMNQLDIDYIFSSPGSEYIPLWEHLARQNAQNKKPIYLNIRHESTALSMAKGHYMATGKTQLILTHVITGLLHGAMELKAAYTDQIPLILIVGQNKTHNNETYGGTPGPHYLSFTEIGGQQRLVQPYIKWTEEPHTNANTLSTIQRAHQIASTDPKGPTLINLSRELLFEKNPKMHQPPKYILPNPITANPTTLKKLAKLLIEAENPLIYTKYLGRNHQAVHSLVKLTEKLSIPVFETPSYTNYPTNHPLHMGTNINPYIPDADLILVIDSSAWPPWYPPKSIKQKTKAKIIFMDLDPLQQKYPTYDYPSDLLIQADSNIAIPQIIELIKQHKINEDQVKNRLEKWTKEHQRIRDELKKKALAVKNDYPIHPIWLCHCINETIDEKTAIINETITHGRLIHQHIERNRTQPGTRYDATGPIAHTGLGQGMGVALGVKLADPTKTVIALEGDGSFNYNPVTACFGAAQEYNIPYMTIIFNNGCYAAMKSHQRYYPNGHSVKQNTYYGVNCGPIPQYAKLAEAYNGHTQTIEDPTQLKQAIKTAIKQTQNGKLTLLDVRLKQ